MAHRRWPARICGTTAAGDNLHISGGSHGSINSTGAGWRPGAVGSTSPQMGLSQFLPRASLLSAVVWRVRPW
jgi:hypothetical protein